MNCINVKRNLYSQLESLYDGIREYIDESDKIIDRKTFEALSLDEALKEVFSYRDYVYSAYDLLNGENVEMFDIELPDMDLRGFDLRNLHLTNYVPGTFDENWNFTPSTVNFENTRCVVNLNTAQYVLGHEGRRRCVDLRGFNFQGCDLYGRITENLGEGCYKRIIEDGSTTQGDGKEIDVLIGEKTLTDTYKRRMARTTPLKINERYIYERILKKGPTMAHITRRAKLNDMDLSEAELSEQLVKMKMLANNNTDISYTGAFIATNGPQTIGRENYYLDLNLGLINAIKNGEDAIVLEELIAAGADPNKCYYPIDEDEVVHWTTPAGLAVLNKEKANEYLDVLLKNGLNVDEPVNFDTKANMRVLSSTTIFDYKIARDYFWDRIEEYPELKDRLEEADEKFGTKRNEEKPEEKIAKTNREEIVSFLKDEFKLTDDEIASIEKKDPDFFEKRAVKDDLDIKLKILEANGVGKTVLLKTPKHLNQTADTIYSRTKFFSKEKVKVNEKNYHKTIFMPKTKFAENYGRRLVKRDSSYGDRIYTDAVDKKLKKKYPLPETQEKLIHEIRMMNRVLGDE